MKDTFRFKEFSISQENCAMKIGTDGVLLGAWVKPDDSCKSILDIGAGTGLIALMLAQRSNAETIDAVEIDPGTYEQCVENFEASPWADRLFCYHAGFNEFIEEMDDQYDLIISNPPFYSEEVSSASSKRDRARQNSSLPFDLLLSGVKSLLSPSGLFGIIVPYREEDRLLKIAGTNGLHPCRITRVRGTSHARVKRSLIEFRVLPCETSVDELIIEKGRHEYTEDYRRLTSDFYLNM